MIARVYSRWGSFGRLGWVMLAMFFALGATQANGLKTSAVLIWGANEEVSPDPKMKPVEANLAKELADTFKWKHYFEVRRKEASIPEGTTNKFVMSDKCTVEVKNLGTNAISVVLIGDGKLGMKGSFPFCIA